VLECQHQDLWVCCPSSGATALTALQVECARVTRLFAPPTSGRRSLSIPVSSSPASTPRPGWPGVSLSAPANGTPTRSEDQPLSAEAVSAIKEQVIARLQAKAFSIGCNALVSVQLTLTESRVGGQAWVLHCAGMFFLWLMAKSIWQQGKLWHAVRVPR
jgi:hypothetical protein